MESPILSHFAKCCQIFRKTLNCTPSTIGSTSPGPESSSNSGQEVFFSLTKHHLLLFQLLLSAFYCCQLLLSCRGADEEREDLRILFKIETIFLSFTFLPTTTKKTERALEMQWSVIFSCGAVSYLEACLVLLARVHRPA